MSAAKLIFDKDKKAFYCSGDWSLSKIPFLQNEINKLKLPEKGTYHLYGDKISKIDSAGAWLIIKLIHDCKDQGLSLSPEEFSQSASSLLKFVNEELAKTKKKPQASSKKMHWMASLGRYAIELTKEGANYLSFVGQLTIEMLRLIKFPANWRLPALVNIIYRTGYQALPIIALLSCMIGVVLTYQMGLQLKNYGANIYIVDLLGLAILREFGPLLTAIMVAGRTGSAFTAQLGMMKLNQEIDALNTMGVTPAELLLLPRIFGLLIALPLLTIWSDIFGVVGGMLMANNMLDITWYDFLHRFPQVIRLKTLLIGLGKAPIFALIIASISCYEGMEVKLSADSVGRNTTKSVVLSIFFIIVADAIFSIIFSKLKL